jgi:hypothetical protein
MTCTTGLSLLVSSPLEPFVTIVPFSAGVRSNCNSTPMSGTYLAVHLNTEGSQNEARQHSRAFWELRSRAPQRRRFDHGKHDARRVL